MGKFSSSSTTAVILKVWLNFKNKYKLKKLEIMLSNNTVTVLEKKLAYTLTKVKEAKGDAMAKFINRELSSLRAMISEAKSRKIIGVTPKGALVYLAPSEWDSVKGECLYIEGLPSGWDASAFDLKSGSYHNVTIDGGQKWFDGFTVN